jgi:hypothetical protein
MMFDRKSDRRSWSSMLQVPSVRLVGVVEILT